MRARPAAAWAGTYLQRLLEQRSRDVLRRARARGLQRVVPDDLHDEVAVLEAHHGRRKKKGPVWRDKLFTAKHFLTSARTGDRTVLLIAHWQFAADRTV